MVNPLLCVWAAYGDHEPLISTDIAAIACVLLCCTVLHDFKRYWRYDNLYFCDSKTTKQQPVTQSNSPRARIHSSVALLFLLMTAYVTHAYNLHLAIYGMYIRCSDSVFGNVVNGRRKKSADYF